MELDPLVEEIMSKVRYRTDRRDDLKLTIHQYNAVCEAIDEWIQEGGNKIRKMVDEFRL